MTTYFDRRIEYGLFSRCRETWKH